MPDSPETVQKPAQKKPRTRKSSSPEIEIAKVETVPAPVRKTRTRKTAPAPEKTVENSPKPAVADNTPSTLKGIRRELTKDQVEELAALQCQASEIIGYAGTTEEAFTRWCDETYHLSVPDTLEMLRQDGLIEIRRAGFALLMKNATLVNHQYLRYLPTLPSTTPTEAATILSRRIFSTVEPTPEEMAELFSE